MDINKSKLDQKNQELAHALADAQPAERDALIDKLRTLSAIQQAYEKLCRQFEAAFESQPASVEIEITQGALSQSYLNLRDAVAAGLIAPEQPLRIHFINVPADDIIDAVRPNGYLRSRSAARRFYEAAGIRSAGAKFRLTKTGDHAFSLELLTRVRGREPAHAEEARRLPPFTFSECGIGRGEKIVSVDDPNIVCTVCDDKHVLYNGRRWSLSSLAMEIRGTTASLAGPRNFTWRGTLLSALRRRSADMER